MNVRAIVRNERGDPAPDENLSGERRTT
jgi:hypothetical protein